MKVSSQAEKVDVNVNPLALFCLLYMSFFTLEAGINFSFAKFVGINSIKEIIIQDQVFLKSAFYTFSRHKILRVFSMNQKKELVTRLCN